MEKLWLIIDRLFNGNIDSTELTLLFRRRMFVIFNLVSITIGSYMVFSKLVLGQDQQYIIISFLFLVPIIALSIFKLVGRQEILIFLYGITFILFSGKVMLENGTFVNSFIFWVPFIPFIVTFLAGKRFGGVIALLAIAEILYITSELKGAGLVLRGTLNFEEYTEITKFSIIAFIITLYILCALFDTTRRIMEEKLLRLKNKMMESSRSFLLTKMSAGISHEINNPLCAIRFANEVVRMNLKKEGFKDEKVYRMLDKIDLSIDKASIVVEALKDIAGDDIGNESSYYKILDISGELKRAYHQEAIDKEVTVSIVNNVPVSEELFCDRTKVVEALVHIVSNAISAAEKTENGWVKVIIEKNKFVDFYVIDSGTGVPKEIEGRIFDPFFTTRDVNEGMGLGLSLTKSIMKKHSGDVCLEHFDGNTCFLLRFPVI